MEAQENYLEMSADELARHADGGDALYCLYDRHIFSCDDLLALDRGLFTCTVSISNAF